MTSDSWQTILALVILVLPLAYCEIKSTEFKTQEKLACIEAKGNWESGDCYFEN